MAPRVICRPLLTALPLAVLFGVQLVALGLVDTLPSAEQTVREEVLAAMVQLGLRPLILALVPAAFLTWLATRWAHRNRQRRSVRAFKQGMAPVVIGLLMAATWVLGRGQGQPATDALLWLLAAVVAVLVWRTRLHLLWLLAAGALLGALGWV